MKIIEMPFNYYPDQVGGTEIYVEALCRELQTLGCEVVIAAPDETSQKYIHEGVRVHRMALSSELGDVSELYDEGDVFAAQEFAGILEEEKPDIVHLHAFTRGTSLRIVREARKRHIPVIFTCHIPGVICQRGTLLEWGKYVCDGHMEVTRCSQCTLHSRGMNPALSRVFGRVPVAVGKAVGRFLPAGKLGTTLRTTSLLQMHQQVVHDLMAEADCVVAVCDWIKEALLINDVPESKIVLSRQGLCQEEDNTPAKTTKVVDGITRMAFLGRLDSTKGVHLLIDALRGLPTAPLELHVYGIAQGETGQQYLQHLHRLSQNDSRIVFHSPVPSRDVVTTLRQYDVLAVPSQWLETGPLVVLEAFAAGIPVIGSDLGGIAELVQHGVNGLLVEYASVEMWRSALEQIVSDSHLLQKLQAGVRPPKQMSQTAEEMLAVYQRATRDCQLNNRIAQ